MTERQVTREKIRFRPQARLLYIVGSDLIKDEMAGVIELVKNSYDADASCVTLRFCDLVLADGNKNREEKNKTGYLCIEDDGHGMSKKVIIESWMSPATDVKGRQERSPDGRPMLGRKGVGRFSAMRLGRKLILETAPDKQAPSVKPSEELAKKYRLEIDWSAFERSGVYLEKVNLELQILEDREPGGQGTRLIISGLNDQWDKERILRLYRELRLLLSPIPHQHQKGFQIRFDFRSSGLDADFVRKYSRPVEPYSLPEITDYIVEADVDEYGQYKFRYKRHLFLDRDSIELTENDFGNDVRVLFGEENRKRFPPMKEGERRLLPCGPLKMQFYLWDRDLPLLLDKAKKLAGEEKLGARAIGRLLDDFSGVAIYRDGFGVRPYGPRGEDWLGLAQRRVQRPSVRLAPNQLFGHISISSHDNPQLDDKASREGLKDNEAFKALSACVMAVISWVEPIRFRFRERQDLGRPEPDSTKERIEARQRQIEELSKVVSESVPDQRNLAKITRLLKKTEKAIDREHERIAEQSRIMHDSYALGLLARFVLHEGNNLDGALDSALNNLERISRNKRLLEPPRLLIDGESLDTFDTSLLSSRNVQRRLESLLDQLDPLTRPRRRRRPRIVVEDIVEKVYLTIRPELERAMIDFSRSKGTHGAICWEADLYFTLFNLIGNSIYWVQQTTGPRKVEIQVGEAEKVNGKPWVSVVVSDSGKGVPVKSAPYIFELGYSEKDEGYGAGLFFSREAIERSGGSIGLLNPGERGGEI